MSDTNTNNDAINSKNNKNINGPDVGNFILYYALGMLGIVLWVLFGTAWLYICKIKKCNIIPTDTNYEPYTCDPNPEFGKDDNDNDKPATSTMNTLYDFGLKGIAFWQAFNGTLQTKLEQEATFDSNEFIDSFKDGIIAYYRDSANIKGTGVYSSTGFDEYLSDLLNDTINIGFRLYYTISSTSDKIPDWFRLFLYGTFGLLLFPFFWVINFFNSIIKVFLKLRRSKSGLGRLDFIRTDDNDTTSAKLGKGIVNWILFPAVFWFILAPLLFIITALFATFYPFFKLLGASYTLKVNNNEQSDTRTFWDFRKMYLQF